MTRPENNNMKQDRHSSSHEALDSAVHETLRQVVRDLPQDDLSMAWRSGLNEQLRAIAEVKRKRRLWVNWALKPALGLGATSAAMFVMFASTMHTPTTKSTTIEGLLVEEHRRSSTLPLVSEVGAGALDAANEASVKTPALPDWNESDTESL